MLRPFGTSCCRRPTRSGSAHCQRRTPLLGDALASRARCADLDRAPRRRDARFRAGAAGAALSLLRASGRRRRAAGAEPAGRAPGSWPASARPRSVPARRTRAQVARRPPVARPLPRAAGLLPDRLSASACEALRTCPYRFFALRLLHLREADELDDEFEKRDYGTWLHAVLHRFHATRARAAGQRLRGARLHAVADEIEAEMGFDAAAFLPFQATFARLRAALRRVAA